MFLDRGLNEEGAFDRIQAGGRVERGRIEDLARQGRVSYFDPKPAYFEQIGRLVAAAEAAVMV